MASKVRTDKTAPGLTHDVVELVGTLRSLVDRYRPEAHYMRGPGPKWRAKHAKTPSATSTVPSQVHVKG